MAEIPGEVAAVPGRELAWLNEQAAAVRAEIDHLRQDLLVVTRDIDSDRTALLLAANEQLVLAALRAEAVAEIAVQDLAAITAQLVLDGAKEPPLADAKLLAIVAHELRSPLVPIRAAANLLKRAHADEQLLTRLRIMIEHGVAHMSTLVEDLVDVGRAATGKFRLERRPIDLNAILALAVESCRPTMDSRLQHFRSTLAPGPVIVWGDHVRLTQIVSNLLENASKYTHQGGHISLAMAMHEGSVAITILDDGTGMTEDHLLHAFELFSQADRARHADERGLGVGLAIVRELVEAHGGSVAAHSAGLTLGSEFVIMLPLRAPDTGGDDHRDTPDLTRRT
jgi:diguanylate cyclase